MTKKETIEILSASSGGGWCRWSARAVIKLHNANIHFNVQYIYKTKLFNANIKLFSVRAEAQGDRQVYYGVRLCRRKQIKFLAR